MLFGTEVHLYDACTCEGPFLNNVVFNGFPVSVELCDIAGLMSLHFPVIRTWTSVLVHTMAVAP